MSYYELTTLDTVIFGAGKASPGIQDWIAGGTGRFLGAWGTDIGTLNRVFLLRGFDSLTEMMDERERALMSADPFGCTEQLVRLTMESYRALDFLTKHGLAHRIERLNAFIACTHLQNAHAPAFLICRSCERVVEAESDPVGGELGRAATQAGFVIERTVREAEGLCPACAGAAPDVAGDRTASA